jgi:hypothetical protein
MEGLLHAFTGTGRDVCGENLSVFFEEVARVVVS